MRVSVKSSVSLLLALVLTVSMSACSKKSNTSRTSDVANAWPTADQKITFNYWAPWDSNAAASMSSYNEHPVFRNMEKLTNIHLNFIHPAVGNESTEFNLMLASNNLPDIIEYNWLNGVTGNAQNYIDDNVIISLDNLLSKYAPDAKKSMTQTDVIKKLSTTNAGHFYAFNCVTSKSWKSTNANTVDTIQSGPIVRADWLADLNLKEPTTWAEWTNVLTAFKQNKGSAAPLTASGSTVSALNSAMIPWMGVYNTYFTYYQRDGKVVYGPTEDNYKAFLTAMHKWYQDGLLDPDFATNDSNAQKANMLNGVSGAFVGLSGSGLQTYMNTVASSNPSYDLEGVQYPFTISGKDPSFMPRTWEVRTGGMAAITSACKNPEYAAMYLNYFYTDDGMMLKNFGEKGVTWNYDASNNVVKTELLTKNPNGLSASQALAKYSLGDRPSPGYVLKTFDNITTKSAQRSKESSYTWFKYADNSTKVMISPAVTLTSDESSQMAQYSTNLNTYVSEMLVKFIMGTANIDSQWSGYVAQCKTLGVDQVVKLEQTALNRSNSN